MADTINIKLPVVPGIREIVLREEALVYLDSAAADVRVETVYPLIRQVHPPPPRVTSNCDKIRAWTFSGSHMTNAAGTVEIHLNKFLNCVGSVIKDVEPDASGVPVTREVTYSNYIGNKPNFTATPESPEAVFVTTTISMTPLQPPQGQFFTPQAFDVKVTVHSWKHDGTAAPNVEFDWVAIGTLATVSNF
jgi:hypothetical protein